MGKSHTHFAIHLFATYCDKLTRFQKSTFGDGGEIYEIWRTPPVDLYLRVFLWNVTNRDEFMSGKDIKLKMQEVGPYVYKWVPLFISTNH